MSTIDVHFAKQLHVTYYNKCKREMLGLPAAAAVAAAVAAAAAAAAAADLPQRLLGQDEEDDVSASASVAVAVADGLHVHDVGVVFPVGDPGDRFRLRDIPGDVQANNLSRNFDLSSLFLGYILY